MAKRGSRVRSTHKSPRGQKTKKTPGKTRKTGCTRKPPRAAPVVRISPPEPSPASPWPCPDIDPATAMAPLPPGGILVTYKAGDGYLARLEVDPEPIPAGAFRDWHLDTRFDEERLEWERARRREAMASALTAMVAHAVATVPEAQLPEAVRALVSAMLLEAENLTMVYQDLLVAKRRMAGGRDKKAATRARAYLAIGKAMIEQGESLDAVCRWVAAHELPEGAGRNEKTLARWAMEERRDRVFARVKKYLAEGMSMPAAAARVARDMTREYPVEAGTVIADYHAKLKRSK